MEIILSDEKEQGISIFSLSGELDLSSKQKLIDLSPNIVAASSKGIIADLSRLTYMDSAGIEAIFRLLNQADKKGFFIAFVAGNNLYIKKKFKELGIELVKQAKIFENIEEAKQFLITS